MRVGTVLSLCGWYLRLTSRVCVCVCVCVCVYAEGSDAEGLDLQHISVLAVTLNRARIQSTPFLTLPNHLALSANAVYHESKIADDIVTDPPRVLIVHSYSERYYWTVDEQTGFVQGLRRWGYDEGEVQVKVFNMDTKQYDARAPAVVRVVQLAAVGLHVTILGCGRYFTTVEDKEWIASVAVMYVELFKPKVVLLSDDNALKYFAVPYLEAHSSQENSTNATSFVFTGVNNDPSKLYPHIFPPDGNRTAPICGTMEVTPYVSIVEGMKALKPSLTNIVVVTDDSALWLLWAVVECHAQAWWCAFARCVGWRRPYRQWLRVGACTSCERSQCHDRGVCEPKRRPPNCHCGAVPGNRVGSQRANESRPVRCGHRRLRRCNALTVCAGSILLARFAVWMYAPWTIKNDDGKAIGTNDLNFINWFLQHNTLGTAGQHGV